MDNVILLLTLLFIKHYVVDFPLQLPYQWKNKGTYGHPGGILHALLHCIGTALVIWAIGSYWLAAVIFGFIDAFAHYHIDWAKMNLNKYLNFDPTKPGFWNLLGFDQLLHSLTYLGIVWCFI